MNKYLITFTVVVIIIIGAYYLLFSNPEEQAATATPTSTPEAIRIGALVPLSGDYTTAGEAALAGAQLAAQEINSAGGVNGRKIELVFEDDQCGGEGAVTAATKLAVVRQVTAIVGPLCSAAAQAVGPVAQAAGIPMLITGGAAPQITVSGDFLYRLYPSAAAQGTAAADYVFVGLQKKKASVVFVKGDPGQAAAEAFIARMKSLGGLVTQETVGETPKADEVKTVVGRVRTAKAEVVYMPIPLPTAIPVVKEIAARKLSAVVVGSDVWDGYDAAALAALEGTSYIVPRSGDTNGFRARVKETTGKEANRFSAFLYDAVQVLAETLRQTGTDKTSLRNGLVLTYFDKGISSPVIEFTDQRELKEPLFDVKRVRNGVVEAEVMSISRPEAAAPTSTQEGKTP